MPSRCVLFLCHLIGSALLLWLGYYWLSVDVSDNRHLIASAAMVLLFIACAAWLHGTSLAHFSGIPLGEAAARSARSLPALVALSLVTLVVYVGITWLGNHLGSAAYVIGSSFTMQLKIPVQPRAVAKTFSMTLLILEWLVVPVLFFPMARTTALVGWRGWTLHNLVGVRPLLYWIEVGTLLFIGVWTPVNLFLWTPKIASFGGQFWSLAGRLAAGYLLFIVALLAIEFFTSFGKPRETQPSTVASP